MNQFDLSGRVGLVTGSSQGIGFALAKGLLHGGGLNMRIARLDTLRWTRLAAWTGGREKEKP